MPFDDSDAVDIKADFEETRGLEQGLHGGLLLNALWQRAGALKVGEHGRFISLLVAADAPPVSIFDHRNESWLASVQKVSGSGWSVDLWLNKVIEGYKQPSADSLLQEVCGQILQAAHMQELGKWRLFTAEEKILMGMPAQTVSPQPEADPAQSPLPPAP